MDAAYPTATVPNLPDATQATATVNTLGPVIGNPWHAHRTASERGRGGAGGPEVTQPTSGGLVTVPESPGP